LLQAVIKADAEVDRLKAEIDTRKWRIVADGMKNLKVSGVILAKNVRARN